MTKLWPFLRFSLAIGLFVGLFHTSSRAVDMGSCAQPGSLIDFEQGVTVITLPFVDPATQSATSVLGTQVAAAFQLGTFASLLKQGNTKVVRLAGTPSDCNPESVLAKLDQITKTKPLDSGSTGPRAVVLVSGRVMRLQDNVYIQTRLMFTKMPIHPEEIRIEIDGQRLAGQIAKQDLQMPLRRIAGDALASVSVPLSAGLQVHATPNEGSEVWVLPVNVGGQQEESFLRSGSSYTILESRDEWRLVSSSSRKQGWIKYETGDASDPPITDLLPEMYLISGIAGYFSCLRDPDDLQQCALGFQALNAYRSLPAGSKSPIAEAVDLELDALLWLVQSPKFYEHAVSLLQQASDLIPYDADAQNLRLIGDVSLNGFSRLSINQAIRGLYTILGYAPSNIRILGNLWSLNSIAHAHSVTTVDTAANLAALEAVRIEGRQLHYNNLFSDDSSSNTPTLQGQPPIYDQIWMPPANTVHAGGTSNASDAKSSDASTVHTGGTSNASDAKSSDASDAKSSGGSITFHNVTRVSIDHIYASSAAQESRVKDLLGKRVLSSGTSVTVRDLNVGLHDFRVGFRDGRVCELERIYVGGDVDWKLTEEWRPACVEADRSRDRGNGKSQVTIKINNETWDIVTVSIASPEGSVKLAGGKAVEVDMHSTATFTDVRPGTYNVEIKDRFSDGKCDVSKVDAYDNVQWVLTNEWLLDCMKKGTTEQPLPTR